MTALASLPNPPEKDKGGRGRYKPDVPTVEVRAVVSQVKFRDPIQYNGVVKMSLGPSDSPKILLLSDGMLKIAEPKTADPIYVPLSNVSWLKAIKQSIKDE